MTDDNLIDDIRHLLIELKDVGFNIKISNVSDILSVLIKYDVPDIWLDDYIKWKDDNPGAKSVLVGTGRLADSCRVANRECLGEFSYKYTVKEHTDRLIDHLKFYGYNLHCVYSQKNGMRFSNHGQNVKHICDYPYKLKLEWKKI